MGEISGFNRLNAEKLRLTIQQTAESVGQNIADEITRGIITPMADAWYAEDAVTFFGKFKDTVNQQAEQIKESFNTFKNNIESTTNSWSEFTGAESVSMPDIDAPAEIKIDISSIQPKNGNGDRALDEDKVEAVITSNIPSTEEAIKSQLATLAQNLDAETSFLGHGQGAAVQSCFTEVVNAVHKIFESLLTGDESLKTALDDYKSKYVEAAEKVANSYNNADTGTGA